jgi:ferrous iron transport protein B
VRQKPHVVVNVVDAANLERNLYLTAQILETGIPLIVVLNMSDVAATRGMVIDVTRLSELLGGVPVIPMTARSGQGIEALKAAIAGLAATGVPADDQPPSGVFTRPGAHCGR